MEREGNLNSRASSPKAAKKTRLLVIIIVLFHLVGLMGFFIPFLTGLFLALVPWHLLLMLVVILSGHARVDAKFMLFALLIFIAGFLAECTGVHTGLLFGYYSYGETLGIKLFGIPLMIGVNWFLLIYCTGVTLQRSRIKNYFARIIAGGLILVLLDILIEPVALQYDYWHWATGIIPIQNYICWFLISALMLLLFEKFNFTRQSIAAPVLLLAQFVFFIALNMML